MNERVIVQNGLVVDPETSTIQKKDIGILNGVFATVEDVKKHIGENIHYIDASGYYVTPGFIDLHAHIFKDYTDLGIDPDLVGIKQGVTTIVDAGSAGYDNYRTFKEAIIEKSKTEILAFLNISRNGLCNGLSELANLNELMSIQEGKEIFQKEKSIVGLKARMSGSVVKDSGIKPLEHARNIANELGKPIMVHIGNPPPNLQEIFPLLKDGDIVTHAFHGKKHGILTESGELIPEAMAAIERGVRFDVGHGTSSFSYKTMRKFKDKYNIVFTISTDIYKKNYSNPVGSLMITMTKLLSLGYSLTEVVTAVTKRAADSLHLTEQGTLRVGSVADVTIFELKEKGGSTLVDSEGEELGCNQQLTPYITLKAGKVAYQK
ncbi:amidohydrolase/deacetylase family metallohydrolase [Cytobacillus firmus]|uniref:amidohydrolase/deacetylase family metallohydrolase n=1 Tax=Cytobacillus firmus TaxID=1399 RepID=UPI0015807B40|nr:amidohydrolase/deacetylase family metallohydrolase [Cytobacillus firmus]NUH83594.1 amidohydrolase/deacetylase family metallohydrolase [Cytobacillus firmus]